MPSKEESLAEISNPIRLKILKKVADHPQALAEIAKDLPISKPEVSRHLSRLQDSRFLTKDPSTRKFEPSPLGETYLQLFSPIDFVFRHQDMPKRSLPGHFVTAYPRKQEDCPDPERGLASVEALYIAHQILGHDTEGLLEHYHWKEKFLEKNFLL